jgi:structural maintenance of chromosome 3 (chondroitin sulfate proteoglycan 6)
LLEIKKNNKLSKQSNDIEVLLNKKKIYSEKKEECIRKIRELGTIPKDHEKYLDVNSKTLLEKLHKVNEKLKKFSHVNKKSLDQYEQCVEQRDQFLAKKKELDDGKDSIEELIKVLDQRKDETILRTFKQVSKYFSDIFAEIVPGGKANLKLISNENEKESQFSNTSGISISVQFPGDNEPLIIQQLSGGQKTLVALTLIFAIQKCVKLIFNKGSCSILFI